MRSWRPRPPSPGLKARLFAAAGEAKPPAPSVALAWGWLAPVTAVLLVAGLALSERNLRSVYLGGAGPQPVLAALALDGRGLVAHVGPADSFERNAPPTRASFSWTNTTRSTSSIGSFLLFNTNSLMRKL